MYGYYSLLFAPVIYFRCVYSLFVNICMYKIGAEFLYLGLFIQTTFTKPNRKQFIFVKVIVDRIHNLFNLNELKFIF